VREPTTRPTSPRLHRNVWATSATSFLADVSTELVVNVLPLFLANVLGVRTAVIGLVEGVAEATASLLKAPAGALSDRLGRRKGLAVAGYTLSALAKPLLLVASSWGAVAAARWGDRVGKGVRTAPRDALLADSVDETSRGLAFGLHRAADTAGAVVGLLGAVAVVWLAQGGALSLGAETFRTLVAVSLVPAGLAVLVLAVGARETGSGGAAASEARAGRVGWRGLGRRFGLFLAISALFDLGNASDAFLVLRAQERGLSVVEVLWMLVAFNAVYAVVSTPAGSLSDRLGRKRLLVAGWLLYGAVYLGFAVAETGLHVTALFVAYGAYYGLTAGAAKALVADLVPAPLRATAFGAYHAALGVIDLPASLVAGVLWQGLGGWQGFGPAAPFAFGAATALAAAALLAAFVKD
jgi:MFS family permease